MKWDWVLTAGVVMILLSVVFSSLIAAVAHSRGEYHGERKVQQEAARHGWGRYELNAKTGKIEFEWAEN